MDHNFCNFEFMNDLNQKILNLGLTYRRFLVFSGKEKIKILIYQLILDIPMGHH